VTRLGGTGKTPTQGRRRVGRGTVHRGYCSAGYSIFYFLFIFYLFFFIYFPSGVPVKKLFWTHPMVLLGQGAQVKARFGLFGDSANLDAR